MSAWIKTAVQPRLTFPTLTDSIVTFNSQYAGLPLKSHKIALTATQSGSGTPSPSNPRPISGYSAINVGCDNKYAGFINFNQLLAQNKLVSSSSVNGIDITNNGDGSFTLNGTSEAFFNLDLTTAITVPRKSHKVIIAFNTLPTGASLFVSGYGSSSGFDKTYWFYKTDGTDWTGGKFSLNIALNTVFDNFRLWVTYYDLTEMLEQTKADELYNEGESGITYFKSLFPNDYYDYNAGTLTTVSAVNGISNSMFTIQIGSTVYGGEYDARTGVLKATHKGVLWSDLTVQQYNGHIYQANVSGILRPTSGPERQQGIMSSNIKVCSTTSISETMEDLSMLKLTDYVYIMITSASTATEARAILGSGQLVYELATPITIQLPPCPIDTLEGVNNIWADTGDTTLQYPKFG